MGRLSGFRRFLCAAIIAFSALGGRASLAEPLRLVTFRLPPYTNLNDDNAPGFAVEVLRQVFAAMGQEASLEELPLTRGWAMVLGGERDGIFVAVRTSERARLCYLTDEPLRDDRWVFFVRTVDTRRLEFSSFDNLVGYNIAAPGPFGGIYVWPELRKFLDAHDNIVETADPPMALDMLVSGRVDYAIVNLAVGAWEIREMGLSGKIEPLLSHSTMEDSYRVCFSKARVSPSVAEAFSRALKQFKQTEAYQAISHKYFDPLLSTPSGGR
jgi:polar amino acid transport system substrate-binding protein